MQNISGSTLTFIGALITLFGGAIAAYGAYRSSQGRADFEKALRQKSEEIASLNTEIRESITGGDGYCVLTISGVNPQVNAGIGVITNHGKYPLYDVSARFVDLAVFNNQVPTGTTSDLLKGTTIYNVGNLAPGTATMVGNINVGNTEARDFNIFYSARNGFTTQLLRMRKVADKWICATKVKRGDKILYEQIDPQFPVDDTGQVKWE